MSGSAHSKPSVSVLIPTHSDAYLLQRSLPVLLGNAPDEIEILIVNNDPSQDVRGAIGESADDSRVAIVEMGLEGNFSLAVNRGILETTGGLVMLCNADLLPSETYLSEMIDFFAEHQNAGAAIGKLLRFDLTTEQPTDVIDTAGLVLTRQRRLMTRGEGEPDRGQFDEAVEIFAIDGAAPILRRTALEAISVGCEFLDENFVTHKEDHDVSWRLRLAGWECWYNPRAVAFHGRTTRGLGATGYLSAIRAFRRNELEKSEHVRIHAMKNQWLILLKNEDLYNFVRDFPFILAREAMVLTYNLIFAPRSLVAVRMTLRVFRETRRKRRVAKAKQRMSPPALRRWLDA